MSNLPLKIERDLLSDTDWSKIDSLSNELLHSYSHRQIFRTDTEARISVLDHLHFPTKASKYWQALREQAMMFEQLAFLSFEYRKNEVLIKRTKKKIEEATDDFDIEEFQITLDESNFKKISMQTTASDRVREINMWSVIKNELDDGSFDSNNVDTHQLISYTTKFAITIANTNPATLSSDEFINLTGQFQTAIQRCKDLNVLDELKNNLPIEIINHLQLT